MSSGNMNPSAIAAGSNVVEMEDIIISIAQKGRNDIVLDGVIEPVYHDKVVHQSAELATYWMMAKEKCAEEAQGILTDLKNSSDRLLIPERGAEGDSSIQRYRVLTDDDDEIALKSKTFSANMCYIIYIAFTVS